MATEQDKLITVVEIVDKYSKELNKMREEFGKTSKQLLEVGKTSANSGDGLKKLFSSFITFKGVLLGAGIGIAINQIKNLGLFAIRAASDMSELENITKQVFEKNSQEIAKWADEIDQTVGRSIQQLQKYASTFGSMFKGAGFEENTFKEWSKDLTKLTADFSSFFNVADEQAFTAIKGVLTGEAEAMKQFGFILNETTMAEYALAQGIKTKWSALSESEKMQLRYNALMEKTKHIHGDAERTIDGYANQLKVAQGQMNNIATAIGNKLLPSAEKALHMFNGLLKVVEDFTKKKHLSDYSMPFLEEKEQISALYQEYEKLSKAPTRSTEDEERRLSILDQLKSKYPDILANISSEAAKYGEVKNALEDVIDALNRKVQLQMQADFQQEVQELIKEAQKSMKGSAEKVSKAKVEMLQQFGKYNLNLDKLNSQDMEKISSEIFKISDQQGQIQRVTAEMKNVLSKYADISKMSENELKEFAKSISSYVSLSSMAQLTMKTTAEKTKQEIETLSEDYVLQQKAIQDLAKYGINQDFVRDIMSEHSQKHGVALENLGIRVNDSINKVEGVIYDSQGKIISDTRDTGNSITIDDALNHMETQGVIRAVVGGAMTSFRRLANGMIEMSIDRSNAKSENSSGMRLESFTGVHKETKQITQKELAKILNLATKPNNIPKNNGGGSRGSGKGGGSKGGKTDKNKWEQQIDSLMKTLNDLQTPIDKFKDKIKDLVISINEFEIQKAKFSAEFGNGKMSDVISKEIDGLKKLQELSIEAKNEKETIEYKNQIKIKELLLEQMKLLEGAIEDIEKKNNVLKFSFRNATEDEKKKIDELNNIFKEYSINFKNNVNEKANYGMLSDIEALDKLEEIFNVELEIIEKLKKYENFVDVKKEKIKNDIEKVDAKYREDTNANYIKSDIFGYGYSEKLSSSINLIEQQRDAYLNSLLEYHKLLGAKGLSEEKREEINKEIEKLTNKIKKFVKNIDIEKTTQILAESMNNLDFGKALNENISKAIEEAVKKSNSSNSLNFSVVNDMSKTFTDMIESEKEKLGRVLNEEDIQSLRDKLIDEQIKIYDEKGEVEKAEILRKQQFVNQLENTANMLSKAGNIFSQLSQITGSSSMGGLGQLFSGGANVLSMFSKAGGLSGLKGLGNTFKTGGFMKGMSSAMPFIEAGLAAVNVFSSFRKSRKAAKQKAEQENEARRQQSNQKYAEGENKNKELVNAIKELTASLQEMALKLIQKISENTSDKNIKKQMNYYAKLLGFTTQNYEDIVLAQGHTTSTSKKKWYKGGGRTTHVHYQNLEKKFSEIFGDLWNGYEKDSESLQKFYDQYVSLFNVDKLRQWMGSHRLDKHNWKEIERNFLNFVNSVRQMEDYLLNLPKNGILESFEGINVSDVFEQRKEFEEQLKNIYKSTGRDPEQFRGEIIQKVNELIQGDKVLITAFDQARSRTIEQLSEGNKAIDGLAQGLESYFNNIKTNLSKVMYDGYFQNLEEQYSKRFENIANKLADFRLQGGKNIKKFAEENLSFEDLFLQLRSAENINNDMEEIILNLREQAKRAGLGEDIINSMFPNNKISEKVSKIETSLRTAMETALDTSSFNQFSMSLGDSIYESVKDSLVNAFTESSKFQQLMEKYFVNDEYNRLLEQAQTFEEAYKIIKNKQDEVENRLKSQGLGFRETDATTGEYLGGLSTQVDLAKSRLAQEAKSFNFTLNLENKGFLALNDFMDTLKKEMKEFMYKSVREEA